MILTRSLANSDGKGLDSKSIADTTYSSLDLTLNLKDLNLANGAMNFYKSYTKGKYSLNMQELTLI